MCVILQNLVLIGQIFAEIWRFFQNGGRHIATPIHQKASLCAEDTTYRSLGSVHQFLHSSSFYPISKILCFTMLLNRPDTLKITPSRVGSWTPIKYRLPWTQPSPHSKRHLGSAIFAVLSVIAEGQPTDRLTDHVTPSVAIGHI